MNFWRKNPGTGKLDTMLTLALYSFVIVAFRFLFSNLSFGSVTIGQLDAGVVTAFLAPTLTAYVARRHSDNMTNKKEDKNDKQG